MTAPVLRAARLELDGLVLRCSRAGTVLAVVHDVTGIGVEVGDSLAGYLAPGDHEQALRYLGEVARSDEVGAVWWPLAAVDGEVHLLQVVGARVDDDGSGPGPRVLVVAAPGPQALDALLMVLARTDPEIAGRLRRRAFPETATASDADHELLLAVSDANAELLGLHRELASDHARLETAFRQQEQVLAMAAHDLRNPLGVISGFSDHLRRSLTGAVGEDALVLLGRIHAQASRGLRLVEDLLDLSAIESGTLRLEAVDTEVCRLVGEVVAANEAAAADKGVAITVTCPTSLVARVDPDRFGQVVDNLVSNAVKFTPAQPGGTVEVTCERDRDRLRLRVCDRGIGIDPTVRPRIFQPFARAGTAGTGGEASTGLGLAIVRLLVEAHDGHVGITSTPGEGTTVEVLLPLAGPAARSEDAVRS